MTYELDSAAQGQRSDNAADEPPMSLAELQASAERVQGADVPLRPTKPEAALDLRRPAAERLVMQTRAQLALFRPGPEVTALRDLLSEFLAEPGNVFRISGLLSGADNHYIPDAGAHPLVGRWVPDFAVSNAGATQRIAELARSGWPVLVDLTESGAVSATMTGTAEQLTVAAGRPVGEIAATAVLVRPDGYVAWASSQTKPEPDELRSLCDVLAYWFGI